MRALIVVAATLLSSAPVLASDARIAQQLERTLDQIRESRYEVAPGLRAVESTRLLYGAYITMSGWWWDSGNGDKLAQAQVDGRFWLHAQVRGHTAYGRLRLRYRRYDAEGSLVTPDAELVDPVGDRYWYRFDWRTEQRSRGRGSAWNWWAQVGRQNFHVASGLVLSDVMHGARIGAEAGPVRLEGIFGITGQGNIDFDSSRPDFPDRTDRTFWGVLLDVTTIPNHRPYAYFIDQIDRNDDVLPGFGIYQYDSSYVAIGSVGQITGQLLYRVEVIKQFGSSASDLFGIQPQTVDDIDAWAGRVELVYSPRAASPSAGLRVEMEILAATGDPDRSHTSNTIGGNLAGTDDTAFNAFGYANTGLALAPALSNLISVRFGISGRPSRGKGIFDRLRFAGDFFVFGKLDPDAPLNVPTTTGDRFVGVELDLILEWQVFHDVSFDLRWGLFYPGDAFPDNKFRQFLYMGVSYGF